MQMKALYSIQQPKVRNILINLINTYDTINYLKKQYYRLSKFVVKNIHINIKIVKNKTID